MATYIGRFRWGLTPKNRNQELVLNPIVKSQSLLPTVQLLIAIELLGLAMTDVLHLGFRISDVDCTGVEVVDVVLPIIHVDTEPFGRIGFGRPYPQLGSENRRTAPQRRRAKSQPVDETVIQRNDERHWLFGAVNPETNEFLHVILERQNTELPRFQIHPDP